MSSSMVLIHIDQVINGMDIRNKNENSTDPPEANLQSDMSPLDRLEAAVALADAFKEQIGERRDFVGAHPARAVMQPEG